MYGCYTKFKYTKHLKYFILKIIANIFSCRCEEYILPPIRIQVIIPPFAKSREQIRDIFLGIWAATVSSLTIATAYRSSSSKYLLQLMHPISLINMVTTYTRFYLTCCHFDHYTHACNMENFV